MQQEILSTKQVMNRIYKDICGFEIPSTDSNHVKKSKGSPIYGEIQHASLGKLLEYLALNQNDIFYDFGSGVGKVVVQTAMTTAAKKIVGVELSVARHQEAEAALLRACAFNQSLKNRVLLLNDNLMNVDISDATVIYTCSTAFSVKFMYQVANRLAEFKHKFRFVSLQELSSQRHFRLLDVLRLDMSWARKTPVHIYERQ